ADVNARGMRAIELDAQRKMRGRINAHLPDLDEIKPAQADQHAADVQQDGPQQAALRLPHGDRHIPVALAGGLRSGIDPENGVSRFSTHCDRTSAKTTSSA